MKMQLGVWRTSGFIQFRSPPTRLSLAYPQNLNKINIFNHEAGKITQYEEFSSLLNIEWHIRYIRNLKKFVFSLYVGIHGVDKGSSPNLVYNIKRILSN